MLKTLDVPTSNISALKKSPTSLFEKAEKAQSGVYIFNRNTPSGVVMSVKDYEKMVNKLDHLEEKIGDLEVVERLKNNTKLYTDQEVRGKRAAGTKVIIDEDDGWE